MAKSAAKVSAGRGVLLMVGTRRGAFLLSSDTKRTKWKVEGPLFGGWEVHTMALDRSAGRKPVLLAGVSSPWWGPQLHRSEDMGKKWKLATNGLAFGKRSGHTLKKAWKLEAGTGAHEGVVYAGVEPAALFRSDDRGGSWTELKGLTSHSTRGKWMPGAGGLMVHHVSPDPRDGKRLMVAISAAGAFETTDGGKTWAPRNKGVRSDFLPEKFPEVGQCVHSLMRSPADPDFFVQQNHCGFYVTSDPEKGWADRSRGLPSRFGFPVAAHPLDAGTIYAIPVDGNPKSMTRAFIGGKMAVWRTKDRGKKWERCAKGLPQEQAWTGVLRGAMAMDGLPEPGLYFGTNNGQLFMSDDGGSSYRAVQEMLPPIYSVSTAVLS